MKTLVPLAESGKINPEASIRDRQSIIINASIAKIWTILTDIKKWPDWNPAIKSTEIHAFEVGAIFKWNLGGSGLTSTIRSIKEPEVLSWTGSGMGMKAIHVWKLEKTEEDQTVVTTEESLQGFLTLFFSHQKLHSTLITWLDRLKAAAER